MSIKEIFEQIANESSTNEKMVILGKFKDNELLKRVLYLANSKRVKFYIKQIPPYTIKDESHDTLENNLTALDLISSRKITGGNASEYLKAILQSSEPEDAYIIERIIDKDCKIGMGTSNMNKIFPKLIEDTPYMGAKSFSEDLVKKILQKKTKFGHYSQIKMDGRYCNAIIRSGDVELESRQGEPTTIEGALFLTELSKFEDCVLNGELTIKGISRYESNGIIASLVSIGKKKLDGKLVTKEIESFELEHEFGYQEALDKIKFTVWDKIEVEEYFNAKSSAPYHVRFDSLTEVLNSNDATMVDLVETERVNTYEEAIAHFQKMLANGEEGTILKAYDGVWKDGKPTWQVKMKLEIDVDLKIIGFNLGTKGTKNENVISSVTAESSDGLVVTRPQGMDEKLMKFVTENQDKLLGTILEVKCSGLSSDSDGNYSLLHPVFKKLRDDKMTCDSLQSIKEIENMAKGLVTMNILL
jgi:ATP-dependent DNA ligase